MALAQDQAQANQSQSILDEQKYQKDLAQYETDSIQWEKEKAAIEAENKIIVAAETKRRADEQDAYTKAEDIRVAELNNAEDIRVAELKTKDDNLVATAVSFVKEEQVKVKAAKTLADSRQAKYDTWLDSTTVRNKNMMKEKKFSELQGLPFEHGDIIPRDPGRGSRWSSSWNISASYYQRASDKFGITPQQARKASEAGARSLSGKKRDAVLRKAQDLNDGGNRVSQYAQNRALAAKVTASAYGAIAVKKAQSSGTNTATDIYGSASLVGTTIKAPQGSYAEQIETARRTQRTIDLRAGNVGFATALLEPVTDNTYINTSGKVDALTLTKTFLTERGYDLNNLDAVPDSVFTTPTKYVKARKQTTSNAPMGDLTKLVPAQPTMYEKKKVGEVQVGATLNKYYKKTPNAELVKRTAARQRLESIRPVQNVVATPSASTVVSLPVTKTFDTKDKADSFDKGLESGNNQPIKSDNEFVNAMRYSDLVDAGEVAHPRDTPSYGDDLLYYSSAGLRPIYNLGLTGYNLAAEQQTAIKPTTLESFAGGLIESAQHAITGGQSGRPIQQTMGETWNHFMADPVRSLVEIPAEIGITLVGGKAIQGLSRASLIAKESLKASTKTPQVVKTIIQTGEKIDFKVKMLNPVAKKNYQNSQEMAKDLYSKYPNKSSYNVDVINSKTFLITAGTETAPVTTPAMVIKYGKEGVKRTERESLIYTEYQASVHPIKAVKVQGVVEKNLMNDVKQTGKYEYTIPATPENMSLLSSSSITNAIKPVGYEVAEKTSMLSKDMRYATMSAIEDPTIQKTNLTVLGETQANKWYVTPRDKIFSKDNNTFYKKNSFTNKKAPEETIPKPVGTILKNKSITSQSNNTLKARAKSSITKPTQNSYVYASVITQGLSQRPTSSVTTSVKTDVRQSQELTPALKQATSQVTSQVTRQTTRQSTKTQTRTKLRLRPLLAQRVDVRTQTPLPTRTTRRVGVVIGLSAGEKNRKRDGKKRNRKNFLGNSRLDNIVGLFKRDEIITGDKKTAKQLKEDKKYKEKKKSFGFSSKKGIKI